MSIQNWYPSKKSVYLHMNIKHTEIMKIALNQGERARKRNEVPIGAVLVADNHQILAAEHNQTITLNDPTAHAEILTLRVAAAKIGNYRLLNTILYVTVEPCPMCMGAAIHARVSHVIFGARDPKWGAAGSVYNFAADRRFNHHLEVLDGICESECKQLIQNFFRQKRSRF
jgi:tRNA(adenine34) deaminase